jgi:hypothetical protein
MSSDFHRPGMGVPGMWGGQRVAGEPKSPSGTRGVALDATTVELLHCHG